MIIRNLKKEDIVQLAKLQCIKEQYIDKMMEIEEKTRERKIK